MVVRTTTPGMPSRMRRTTSRMDRRSPVRFISFSTLPLPCCTGMSMYLQTLGSAAMVCISSSVMRSG